MADKKVSEINAANLRIQGEAGNQYVEVDGLKIRLSRPMDLPFKWVGNKKLVDTMKSCWYSASGSDYPMNPRLVGKPGTGKTVLAYSVGKLLDLPVYFFQATSDTQPNDVLIGTVIVETGAGESKVEYIASPLISAMLAGGALVFDEANRMQEKAWAALAPLLDTRRYVDCVSVGVKIKAHPNFRFVATMNDDASCFELPEYIKSRLQPTVLVENPDRAEERRILEGNLPHALPIVLDYVADFLEAAHRNDERYSVREGIHIANYATKMINFEVDRGREMDPGEAVVKAVEQILGVRQTRYIKRVLWEEAAA
ncbi:MAG: AAA family ATPase [Bdellovibrionales bacterium]|nr:AAA family ATPase [Bdellovibrionales bacterium]